jgi:hypothetical protein
MASSGSLAGQHRGSALSIIAMRTTSLLSQKLPDFDADSWEYSRKYSSLERLAFDAGQAGEQRRRGYEIAPVP